MCQSGDLNSTSGCYGDAGSEAFAKVNKLSGNPMGYAGVTGSAAQSVWIRQVGDGTNCTMTATRLYIKNTQGNDNTTIWICGTALSTGSPVSSANALGAPIAADMIYGPGSPNGGILFTTIGPHMISTGTTLTPNELYFVDSPILPTVYVFCISTNTSSVATQFPPQVPVTYFDDEAPC